MNRGGNCLKGIRRRSTGAALVTVLLVSIIVSILILGIGNLAVSHVTLSAREADYAAAIQIAEAGANYELRYISQNQTTGTPAHQYSAPYTGSVAGVQGTFTVYVRNLDGSSPWAPPTAMILRSEGTVNGVTRAIEMQGARNSIFDAFATYALDVFTFNGSGSQVNGGLGTNGTVSSSSSGASAVNGTITYGHPPAGGDLTGGNVTYGPPIDWPTIDEIIVSNPPSGFGGTGWGWLTSNSPLNRSNQNIRTFAASGASLTPGGTIIPGNPAPWTGTNAASMKVAPGNWSAMNQDPGDGKKAIIFPPGDYYFTDFDTGGGTGNKIIMDTAGLTTGTPGRVRIWMNDTGNNQQNDTINVNVYYTATDPSKFRLYYNKCANITVGGNSVYYGGFYAVRTGCTGTIVVGGGSTINGSVVGNNVDAQGGSVINFPGNGVMDDPGDYSLWFGFKDMYKEVPVASGQYTFAGGTNN